MGKIGKFAALITVVSGVVMNAMCAGTDTAVFTFLTSEGHEWKYTLQGGCAMVVSAPQTINGRLSIPGKLGIHTVGSIADGAFAGRDDIICMTMPDSIETIGSGAFRGCSNMTSIAISEAVTNIYDEAFFNCSSLEELTIPDSAQRLGSGVFAGCSSLKKLTIPFVGTMRGVDDRDAKDSKMVSQFGAMFQTYSSESSYGPPTDGIHGTRAIDSYLTYSTGGHYSGIARTVRYTYYIPTNLTDVVVTDEKQVTECAFYGCADLKSIAFLGGVTNIQEAAFRNCNALESVSFVGDLTEIGRCAFMDCWNLKPDSLRNMPATLKRIDDEAFRNCYTLGEITMPDSVWYVDSGAFRNCTNAATAKLSKSLKHIGSSAFRNCSRLTELIVPDSVTWINESALYGCNSLVSLTLPFVGDMRGLSTGSSSEAKFKSQFGYLFRAPIFSSPQPDDLNIGTRSVSSYLEFPRRMYNGIGYTRYTYSIPVSLSEVVITDDNLVSEYAFYGCADLKSIAFLGGVTNIQEAAFRNCSQLGTVTFFGDKPKLGANVFYGVPDSCRLLVSRCSQGWNVDIPGSWSGVAIDYFTDASMPTTSDEADIAEFAATFADERIATNMTTVDEYDAFREWAFAVRLPTGEWGGTAAARDSQYVWLAYMLGTDKLIEKGISSNDIHVVSFDGKGGLSSGEYLLEVAIDGVKIGSGQIDLQKLKDNLKRTMVVEGTKSLAQDFTPENIELEFDVPRDGHARVRITPPSDAGDSCFLRVKIK